MLFPPYSIFTDRGKFMVAFFRFIKIFDFLKNDWSQINSVAYQCRKLRRETLEALGDGWGYWDWVSSTWDLTYLVGAGVISVADLESTHAGCLDVRYLRLTYCDWDGTLSSRKKNIQKYLKKVKIVRNFS